MKIHRYITGISPTLDRRSIVSQSIYRLPLNWTSTLIYPSVCRSLLDRRSSYLLHHTQVPFSLVSNAGCKWKEPFNFIPRLNNSLQIESTWEFNYSIFLAENFAPKGRKFRAKLKQPLGRLPQLQCTWQRDVTQNVPPVWKCRSKVANFDTKFVGLREDFPQSNRWWSCPSWW